MNYSKLFHTFAGKIEVMTRRFGKDYLRMLYEEGRCLDKKHRFQPSVIAKYQKRVDIK